MASNRYNEAVSNTVRRTSAKVTYELIDTTAKDEAVVTVNDEETLVSRLHQVKNDIEEGTNYRFTTLERGYFKLDGSNRLTPKKTEHTKLELGWWSHNISDENGNFNKPPTITYNFSTPHSSVGFTFTFDAEYPTRLKMDFYDLDNALIDSMIVDNDSTKLFVIAGVESYAKVVISFLSTLNPYRRIRYTELTFGIVQNYTDKDIIELKITRDMTIIENSIPVSEIEFTIDNINKKFNIVNPQGVYAYLQDKQVIKTQIGVYLDDDTIEYIDTGKYYLDEWETENITATFRARDILNFISDKLLYSNANIETKSLKEFLIDIFTFAGIEKYNIDSSLDNITVTTKITDKEIKKLIKDICIASNTIIYVDRDNTVIIKPLPTDVTHKIELKNTYKVPKIELDNKYNNINVEVYDPVNNDVSEIVSVNNIIVGDAQYDYDITGNIFITTTELATSVANYYLALLSNRKKYTVDWRQDANIEIAERVNIEDGFNENKEMIITKQELTYKGYLSGSTEGRGIN